MNNIYKSFFIYIIMQDLREKINNIDLILLQLLKERFDISKSIALIKKSDNSIQLYDPLREKEIIDNLKKMNYIDNKFVEEIWEKILYSSKCIQQNIIDNKN